MPRSTAEKNALAINPLSSSRCRSSRPPRRASAATASDEPTAPTKAAPGETRGEAPARDAIAAPVAAPPEVPRRKGSASGFLSRACIAAPARARQAPTKAASATRGNRSPAILRAVSPASPVPAQRSGSDRWTPPIARPTEIAARRRRREAARELGALIGLPLSLPVCCFPSRSAKRRFAAQHEFPAVDQALSPGFPARRRH